MESNHLFRKNSLNKISSPEQLNEYIRVTTPSVWIVLIAVIVLLIGVLVWSVFGKLDTTVPAVGSCENGVFTGYVSENDIKGVEVGMEIKIDGNSYEVSGVAAAPVKTSEALSEYLIYLGDYDNNDWVYEIQTETDLRDGSYEADIVTESVDPISFVSN